MKAKKFEDYCITEKLYIDNVAADNSILSLIKQLQRENKSEYVIKTYLTSIGVSFDVIVNAFSQLQTMNNSMCCTGCGETN